MKKKSKYKLASPGALWSLVGLVVVGSVIFSTLTSDQSILGSSIYLARGGDEDNSGSSGSGSSDSDNSGSGKSSSDTSSGSSNSGSSESNFGSVDDSDNSTDDSVSPTTNPTTRPDSSPRSSVSTIRTQVVTEAESEDDKSRAEVRLSEGERIRTRTKDGETRIDITSSGVKTRFEIKDDRMIIKAELEDGTEVELLDDTLLKIEERLGLSDIKIATAGAEKFMIQKGTVGALTNFPLSIDLATNQLTINTPAGSREVTVLPDAAVQGLLTTNVVSRIGGQAIVDAVNEGTLTSMSQVITLGEQNNVLVYEIVGISDQNLLGFIPVEVNKTVIVSADTGEVVATQTSFLDRVIDILSF